MDTHKQYDTYGSHIIQIFACTPGSMSTPPHIIPPYPTCVCNIVYVYIVYVYDCIILYMII